MQGRAALILVLLAAAWLRVAGLDWDAGYAFHPDERAFVEAALRAGDTNATHAFATRVARAVSAIASIAAVGVGFRFGTLVGGGALGLLFAALLAFCAGLVQLAHFGTPESLFVLWLLASALAAAQLVRGPRRIGATLALLLFGVLAFGSWIEPVRAESDVLQFGHALPLQFQLANLHWLAGPLVPLFGVAGMIGLVAAARRDARWRPALPLVGVGLGYGVFALSRDTQFAHDLLPLLPALLFGAAWAIVALHERRPRLATVAGALLVATSLVWAVAVAAIYRAPNARVVASEWLLRKAPPGSVVLGERGDALLPLANGTPVQVERRQLEALTPDGDAKLATLTQELAAAEFVVLTGDRVQRALRANPDRFPDTSALYADLLAGKLGFELVARFESLPRIGPVRMRDDAVEQSLRDYDHPSVLVFRNTGHRSSADLVAAVRKPAS